jgi:hypothetical protein
MPGEILAGGSGEATMKQLQGLSWVQRVNAQMGCIQGALAYLEKKITTAWLFGGSGYAFVINISSTADESCPTAWNNQMIFDLVRNVGVKITGFSIRKDEAGENFAAKQREASELIRAAIDRGLPCYGWEVQPWMPEFGLITGYDEQGYYYASYEAGGPVKWDEYGDHDVKIIQVYCVEPCPPASDRETLKAVLDRVLQDTATPTGWAIENLYTTGPAAFDLWSSALENGAAQRDGTSYNALAWHECRAQAVDFLQEARLRLAGQISPAADNALAAAAVAYARARDALHALTLQVPMNMQIWDGATPLQSHEAAGLVHDAGCAERDALARLETAAHAL